MTFVNRFTGVEIEAVQWQHMGDHAGVFLNEKGNPVVLRPGNRQHIVLRGFWIIPDLRHPGFVRVMCVAEFEHFYNLKE